MLDEAFAEARARVRFRPVNDTTARELFDAGVAAERERCAKLCEAMQDNAGTWATTPNDCAAAIREGDAAAWKPMGAAYVNGVCVGTFDGDKRTGIYRKDGDP